MNESLNIDCEWWGSATGKNEISLVCSAAIGINVGEHCLTRLVDSWGNALRKRLHADAQILARWFAGNWWRLRWEPESANSRSDVDWRMSHSMGSAGGGFCWPGILFASDGDTIAVAARPSGESVMGPVRYLDRVHTRITAREFEKGIDTFMVTVLSRLHAEGHGNSELAELWNEVTRERGDPKLAKWRRLEAICGYDPDEAPAAIIELVADDRFHLGHKAVEEVAAHSRHQTIETLESIRDLAASKGRPSAGGFQCRPLTLNKAPSYKKVLRPWEKGAQLAQTARKEWSLGKDPVSNDYLAGFLRTPKTVFSRYTQETTAPFPVALRNARGDALNVYIGKHPTTSRRFAASRLLGQWLDAHGATERLIPAADAKTAQQQFQRAFAQEFLCPFEALLDRLQTEYPSQERIDEAADYFGVSPLLVRTTMVNKRELDRDALRWSSWD